MSKEVFDDFIWMSYRYCIGRKTIASCTHANTIAETIIRNPGLLSEERIKFYANDIRDNVNCVLGFKRCLQIDGYLSQEYDLFSHIMYALNDVEETKHKKFIYDIYHETFSVIEDAPDMYEFDTPDSDYSDLIPWVKLANWLDKKTHRTIVVEFNGKTEEHMCYPYPHQIRTEDGKYRYEEVWYLVSNPSIDITRYISKECIKEIK